MQRNYPQQTNPHLRENQGAETNQPASKASRQSNSALPQRPPSSGKYPSNQQLNNTTVPHQASLQNQPKPSSNIPNIQIKATKQVK